MSGWTLGEFGAAAGGRWLAEPASSVVVHGAAIDTRELRAGDAFFAFRGERVDGHRFAREALQAGAACVVVTDVEAVLAVGVGDPGRVLVVDDPRAAMARAAVARRDRMRSATVVGVTGSNGKTSTVRLLRAVLERRGVCAASIKSHNNTIGLALTLLNAPEDAAFVVCEIGTSAPNEIAALAAIARPDVAIVTSVGRAHLEALGSTEGVAHEKADLLRSLRPGGTAMFNMDTMHAEVLREAVPAGVDRVSVGTDGRASLRLGSVDATARGVSFVLADGASFAVPLVGRHHATNAAIAVAVGRRAGLSDSVIAEALAGAEGAPMRLSVREVGGVLIVNDAYNANPDSMAAALDTFVTVAGDRPRVLVLGEMRELGAASEREHTALGKRAASLGARAVVFVGSAARVAGRAAREAIEAASGAGSSSAMVFEQAALDADAVAGLIEPGDAVLFKGSRAVGLERADAALDARLRSASVGG